MILRTDGASGCCGLAVWGDMTPTTTPAAEGAWSHLLICVDIVSDSEEPDSASAKAVESRFAQDCGHHRRGAILPSPEPGSDLCPTQPPNLSRDMNPAVLCLKLLPELAQTPISILSHIPGQRDIVDTCPFPPLLTAMSAPNRCLTIFLRYLINISNSSRGSWE